MGGQGVKVAWLRVLFTPLFTLVVFTTVNKSLHTAGYTRVLVNASVDSFHSCAWPSGSSMGTVCKDMMARARGGVPMYQIMYEVLVSTADRCEHSL